MAEKHDCNSGEETLSCEENPKHSLFYVSCDLRLLAEVAAHVKRCRNCYAVEEESEGLAGGWAIGTPKGSCRSSIVTHPLYVDLTSKSWYYCVSCFKQCICARIPCSEDVQNYLQVLEEKGEESIELVNVSKAWLLDLNRYEDLDKVEIVEKEAKGKEKETDGGVRKSKKKKKKSESTLKGGRCSRINGRKWQCKKLTLQGYALCQYHLALARSRSNEKKFNLENKLAS